MLRVEPLRKGDVEMLLSREANAVLRPFITPGVVSALYDCKLAFTAFWKDQPVACAGVAEYWVDRGEAWAILDQKSREAFMSIHLATRRFLDLAPLRRIEAAVKLDFKAGHRWVRSLGFKLEAPIVEAYCPDGSDAALYARVRR